VNLSPASSSLTPWLWRKVPHSPTFAPHPPTARALLALTSSVGGGRAEQVHERHFGGPVPTKKKEKSFDQRTFCLHSARLLHKCGLLSTRAHVCVCRRLVCY
jgi:hypothetical protein